MTCSPVDDLTDRVNWLIAQLRLKELPPDGAGAVEVLRDLAVAQVRISERAATHEFPMTALVSALGLSNNEMLVVTLLAGHHFHPWVRARVDSVAAVRPPTGVANETIKTLVYGANISVDALHELGPHGRLRRFGILVRGGAPQDVEGWSLSDRILTFLVGGSFAESDASSRQCPAVVQASETVVVPAGVLEQVQSAVAFPRKIVLLTGTSGVGRRSLLESVCREQGMPVLTIDARELSTETEVARNAVRAFALECRLRGRAPLVLNIDSIDERGRQVVLVEELIPLVDGNIFLTCSIQRIVVKSHLPTHVIELGQLSTAQRAALWHSSLGEGTAEDALHLAERYPLAPALIVRASEAARARANGRALGPEDIYAGIRSVLDDRLGQFAKRVTVTQSWDDLVLPPDELDTILELMARVRCRSKVYEKWGFAAKVGKGLGISALFSGPPGTGKTMVAALIARELGLELYQVDMGKVVSKFIGETEKNLGALFDAAEAGHAILLFDEADALFGKRTDVKSSNDRYANLETNYLLQRLESFTGVCLLTTNHDKHIDPAFQRRLSLHLRFELPDVEERAMLWHATLPVAAPLAGDVDFGSLARRFKMSGGYIRNAVLRAAFLAADEDSGITAAHLERAARVEYEGLGKLAA